MTLKTIQSHTLLEHIEALAAFYPGGKAFIAKNLQGKLIRDFLKGLSRENLRCEGYLKALQEQYIPDKTDNFIEEWERTLGIPDDCFTGTGTNDERRRDILAKLASLGVQTAQDFIDLAAIFGLDVDIIDGSVPLTFPYTFPFPFSSDPVDGRFTILVQYQGSASFPLTFPIEFGTDVEALVECLFNKLKPANCQVVFISV